MYHDARFRECKRFFVPRRSCGSFNDDSNLSNAELNPICHFLALLGAHHVLHVSRIRANYSRKGGPRQWSIWDQQNSILCKSRFSIEFPPIRNNINLGVMRAGLVCTVKLTNKH